MLLNLILFYVSLCISNHSKINILLCKNIKIVRVNIARNVFRGSKNYCKKLEELSRAILPEELGLHLIFCYLIKAA